MRIAIVNQPFDPVVPPHQNSLGIWTWQVARRLATQHEVYVYARHMDTQHAKSAGLDPTIQWRFIRTLPRRWWDVAVDKSAGLVAPIRPIYISPLYYRAYIEQVARSLAKIKPDVVHLHNFPQFASVVRRHNPQAFIVLHMHCEWLSQLARELIEPHLHQVDAIIGVSQHIASKVRQRFHQLADRVYTVRNGVDTSDFVPSQPSEQRRLIFVGRVSPEKGVHTLVEAFNYVHAVYPDCRLDIVGNLGSLPPELLVKLGHDDTVLRLMRFYNGTPYADTLHNLSEPAAQKQIRYHGALPHHVVSAQLQQASLLVNPSLSESFGMSLVEAMAAGKPVIATRVGGMPEIVHEHQNGLLVEPEAPEQLADAIVKLFDDETQLQKMGVNARCHAEKCYSWEQSLQELDSVYTSQHRGAKQRI